MKPIVITGTDTGIGKTVFAAALVRALGAFYWKPVQSGLEGPTDSEIVAQLSGTAAERILPEAYRLKDPLSPHIAAHRMGLSIDPDALGMPAVGGPLVIEGAGGVLVPLNRQLLFADLFVRWGAPAVLVARTTLGTINHSLLSIEALRRRDVPLLGIAFVGEPNEESERTIVELGAVRRLGRLPMLDRIAPADLATAFERSFRVEDFRK